MNPAPNVFASTRLFRQLSFLATLAVLVAASADTWPQWRGPEGTGVSAEKNLPLHWGTNSNVRWRVPLVDRGNSTPVVWGNRVFITQAIEKENRRTLMCFNRADGKPLWQSGATYPEKESSHETNPLCSASPVTDGGRVIASFASAGLFCYDFDGKELWRSEEHTSELQSRLHLVCRLLLEKKKKLN